MPCPYFEPLRVVTDPLHATARLPLIDEYEGLCHAYTELLHAPAELRFRYCNHGYSQGGCQRIPVPEVRSSDVRAYGVRSCARFNVVRRSEATLNLLCIEEQNHAPLRWQPVEYSILQDRLSVEINDICLAAQLLAFCRSYLKRFPS